MNIYAYVGNNPINFIDPSGLKTAVVIGHRTSGNSFGLLLLDLLDKVFTAQVQEIIMVKALLDIYQCNRYIEIQQFIS